MLAHGTGALNIDASRIGTGKDAPGAPRPHVVSDRRKGANQTYGDGLGGSKSVGTTTQGRWPANVILDEAAAQALDAQSGERKTGGGNKRNTTPNQFRARIQHRDDHPDYSGDTGGASRFFYCAKASRKERNAGLDGMPETMGLAGALKPLSDPRMDREQVRNPQANHHPTVKPLALMRYLVTLVTPPGGIVLDPFAGSGSTLVACAELGFPAIGIELSEEYCEIIARRVDHALSERPAVVQPSLLEMVAD